MTHRDFSSFASVDPKVKDLLAALVAPSTSSDHYRSAMFELGQLLAAGMLKSKADVLQKEKDICVVCTVEDADFLAKGVIVGLNDGGVSEEKLHLQCFWNGKIRSDGISLSPIIKQYEENFDKSHAVYVIVKSIISGACVVKTNLTRMLSKAKNAEVFVLSPVLLDGAQGRLDKEFMPEISGRFNYVWFATDFDKDGENVLPGIGGSVYDRLGLGEDKNKYMPKIVKERRAKLYGMPVSA